MEFVLGDPAPLSNYSGSKYETLAKLLTWLLKLKNPKLRDIHKTIT